MDVADGVETGQVVDPFDDAAVVHEEDGIAEVGHGRQVVGDEEKGEPLIAAELRQKVHDLDLDGDVEGARGLVEEDEAGPGGDGPGDADPLELSSAELMGTAAEEVARESHLLQKGEAAVPSLLCVAESFFQRLGKDLLDGESGVDGGAVVLEDDAAGVEGGPSSGAVEVLPVDGDVASVGAEKAHEDPPQGAFPAAALADDTEAAPLFEGQREASEDGLMASAEKPAPAEGDVDVRSP